MLPYNHRWDIEKLFHQLKGKTYFEIPKSRLGQELLLVVSANQTPANIDHAGRVVDSIVVRWVLKENRVLLQEVSHALVADPSNLASLKSHALVICLWASPETIWERVRAQTHRPLLQTPDPQARIRELLEQRGPGYRQADVLVHTGFRSPKEVAQQVLHQFLMARK